MAKEMLINTVEGKECRIAIVTNGVLEELYVERVSSASRVGNIYKGRVVNVEPSIQATFVDFGSAKNGFLHISDLHPKYFPKAPKGREPVGKKRAHKDRPPVQDCLRRGQEVVVQMTKEGIGTKGPTMTTYLSIPGRLLVMMPGMARLGVSRKIEDEKTRDRMRKLLEEIKPPPEMGFIVRTAGAGRPQREIVRDLHYLTRLWQTVKQRIKTAHIPAEIYRESDLVLRTIRDVYNSDIDRIVCDREPVARRVSEFLNVAMPRTKHVVEVYAGKGGLFHDTGIEEEIEKIYARRVELRSGGSVAFEQTEALVAIDVNSGRFREHSDAETTALRINIEAAQEIARQLRLRDMGGVIIMDFIDMREQNNRRAVEGALREAMKPDRAKTRVLRISSFGIIEMTRQRVRPSLEAGAHRTCSSCGGTGLVKSEESLSLAVMRNLQRAASQDDVAHVEVTVPPAVAHHLLNFQRAEISQLEAEAGATVIVQAGDHLSGGEVNITCQNARGAPVTWEDEGSAGRKAGQLPTRPVTGLPGPKEPEKQQAESDKPEMPPEQAKEPPPPPARKRARRSGRSRRKSDQATGAAKQPAEGGGGEPTGPEQGEGATEKLPDEAPPAAKQTPRRKRTRGGRTRAKKKTTGTDGDASGR